MVVGFEILVTLTTPPIDLLELQDHAIELVIPSGTFSTMLLLSLNFRMNINEFFVDCI